MELNNAFEVPVSGDEAFSPAELRQRPLRHHGAVFEEVAAVDEVGEVGAVILKQAEVLAAAGERS